MQLLPQFTDDAKQKFTVILADGTSFVMIVEYKPQQTGWFITSLTYKTFSVTNLRIVTNPNIMRQFKNQIPFGLGCFVDQNQEPLLQQDFSSGRAKFYILSSAEVTAYEDLLSGRTSG